MLTLKSLSAHDGQKIYEMLQEIEANENGFSNDANGMTYSEFESWIKQAHELDNGINMPDWMVPQSSYWLFNNDLPIGIGRIRHCLNDSLRETGGHIGYAIRPSERGKGYGTVLLALLMEKSKQLDISQLQVGAEAYNIQSNKIIMRNGGVFTRESNGKNFYRIDIS